MIRCNVVEGARKRGLCLTNGAVFELKEGVMVVHGERNYAQEEA
jgi:hypothetical protein